MCEPPYCRGMSRGRPRPAHPTHALLKTDIGPMRVMRISKVAGGKPSYRSSGGEPQAIGVKRFQRFEPFHGAPRPILNCHQHLPYALDRIVEMPLREKCLAIPNNWKTFA